MNEVALGELITITYLRFVPFLAGGVIAAILTIFALFMFEDLLITYKEKRRDISQNLDQQHPGR